jgi:hypothetical protein
MDELLNLTDTEILQLAESACSDLKDLNEENFIYTVRWIEDVLHIFLNKLLRVPILHPGHRQLIRH